MNALVVYFMVFFFLFKSRGGKFFIFCLFVLYRKPLQYLYGEKFNLREARYTSSARP